MTESGEPESTPGETDEPKGPLVKKVRKRVLVGPKRSPRPAPEVIERVTPSKTTPKKSGPIEHADVRRVDKEARKELAEIQAGRRSFLKKAAIGAGLVALGAGLGFGGGYVSGTGFGGQTVITDTEIAARVIAGVRIATEFIPTPVPAGTDTDPYPGSAIQAALNDGVTVYIPSGTWKLAGTITRGVDNVTILGAGKSTKLVLDGVKPAISAGTQTGWLMANLATDAGGVDLSAATQCRMTEIWVNGMLTDNRPVATGGGGTGGGYYGTRASDFITSGDGSPSNPYNASAIQSAINALPSRGGVVFVKSGLWVGSSRIVTPSTMRRVILIGEGMEEDYFDTSGSPNWYVLHGTHVAAGFDCKTLTDFYSMTISPHPSNYLAQPCVKYIVDMLDGNMGPQGLRWLGGVTLREVEFWQGDPGLWLTGVNIGSAAWQMWEVLVEKCFWSGNKRGLKIDEGDSNGTNAGVFRGDLRQLKFQGNNNGGRTVDIQVTNLQGVWSHWLMEDCSTSSDDYACYIKGYGFGGLILQDFQFGDGSNAQKDARLELYSDAMMINMRHQKDVDLAGSGMYWRGARDWTGTGKLNILGTNNTVETMSAGGYRTLQIGTISSPGTTRILRGPGNARGYIGTTAPSGSPYTYTNNDASDENVYIVGGTVTGITRNGQSLGTVLSHLLAPGDSIVISYSSAPSILRYGLS